MKFTFSRKLFVILFIHCSRSQKQQSKATVLNGSVLKITETLLEAWAEETIGSLVVASCFADVCCNQLATAGEQSSNISISKQSEPSQILFFRSFQRQKRQRLDTLSKESRITGIQAAALGNQALSKLQKVVSEGEWDFLGKRNGVSLWRLKGTDQKFVCTKAQALLDAPLESLYYMFVDNERVSEYNVHCKHLQDLEVFPEQGAKITWSASGKFGPFKARDFCCLVHFSVLEDGTRSIVSCPWYGWHPQLDNVLLGGLVPLSKVANTYIRSEVMFAGHFLKKDKTDPTKTEVITISQINPGGNIVSSPAAVRIINALSLSGPITFLKKLEKAAQQQKTEHTHEKAFVSKLRCGSSKTHLQSFNL